MNASGKNFTMTYLPCTTGVCCTSPLLRLTFYVTSAEKYPVLGEGDGLELLVIHSLGHKVWCLCTNKRPLQEAYYQ